MYVKFFERHGELDQNLPLDPITVGGCASMAQIAQILVKWFPEWEGVLEGRHEIWKYEENQMTPIYTKKHFRDHLKQLEQWNIVERTNRGNLYVSYFEVEKATGNVARAITNCKKINDLFHTEATFRLADIVEICRVVGWFQTPHFATLDFRHWFHQLTLPEEKRDLFCLIVDGEKFRWRTWPMGFKFTPIISQSIAVAILKESFHKTQLQVRINTEKGPDAVVVGLKHGTIAALGIVWYDNIMIVAGNSNKRDAIVVALKAVLRWTRIQLKDEVMCTNQEVEFLGLKLHREDRLVALKHCDQNLARWRVMKVERRMQARMWLKILGVVNWHFRVKGESMGTLSTVYREIFCGVKDCLADGRWERLITIDKEIGERLEVFLHDALSGETYRRAIGILGDESEPRPHYIVTDASNWGGASVNISSDKATITHKRPWSIEELQLHINVKELLAALEGLESNDVRGKKVIIGIDNKTAIARLRSHWKIENVDMMIRVIALKAQVMELRVVYLPSRENAADGPSRNEELDEGLVMSSREHLLKEACSRWYDTGNHLMKEKKRGRDAGV